MSVAAACLDASRTRLRLTQPQALLCRVGPGRMSWRRAPDHLLFLLLRGEMRLRTSEAELSLQPGDAAWIPAGAEHAWSVDGSRTLYRVRIRIDGAPPTATVLQLREAWRLQPLFALLQAETAASADPLRLRALMALLLSYFETQAPVEPIRPGLSATQWTAVTARVAHWRSLGFPTPADLAHAAGLGGDWFARAFHRGQGRSPRAWLADERLRLAQAELLASDAPAAAVARTLGYAHYAQFARAFRNATGLPPEGWRSGRGLTRDRRSGISRLASGRSARPSPRRNGR